MAQLFVVERYDDTGIPGRFEPLPAPPADVHLVCAVRVPVDDVLLALIEGADEPTISAALASAGWRVDRITAATWAQPVGAHPVGAHPVEAHPVGAHPVGAHSDQEGTS